MFFSRPIGKTKINFSWLIDARAISALEGLHRGFVVRLFETKSGGLGCIAPRRHPEDRPSVGLTFPFLTLDSAALVVPMVSAVLNLFESVLISGLLHSAKGKGDVMRPPFMSILVMLATMVTLDPVSHATVVYHSAGVTVEGGAYALDVDGDTVTDFYFSVDRQSGFPPCNHSVEVKESAAPGNLAVEGGPLNKGDPRGAAYECWTGDVIGGGLIAYEPEIPSPTWRDRLSVSYPWLGLCFQF